MSTAVILTQLGLEVNHILAWGRAQATGHTVARLGEFSKSDTESLRRLLRKEYLDKNPAVSGCWREGYEMAIGDERIGVTNGHGSFKIYYRRVERKQQIADLLAEIEADVKAKLARRNAAYDAALSPDPLNLAARRGAWTVSE